MFSLSYHRVFWELTIKCKTLKYNLYFSPMKIKFLINSISVHWESKKYQHCARL